MKEAGILFSAPMVLALLNDRKTQTRRLSGLELINQDPDRWQIEQEGVINKPGAPCSGRRGVLFKHNDGSRAYVPARYEPDTRLWVREAWRTCSEFDNEDMTAMQRRLAVAKRDMRHIVPIQYEADKFRRNWERKDAVPGRYRHARFMPRWASRLERDYVTERIERLQDISEADAIAEGCVDPDMYARLNEPTATQNTYCSVWNEINGAGSWNANPWVWVIEFRRID